MVEYEEERTKKYKWKENGMKKEVWRSVTKDRAAAGRSVERMLEWDFDRVVLAHGDFIEGDDARERARDALWWMLEAA